MNPPADGAGAGGSVLVVDDDPGMRDTVVDILSGNDIEAVGAASAAQALDRARVGATAVAVVDYRLPDASGAELGARLKERDPDIQVVLVTGYATLETAIAAVGLLDDFLTKPVPPDQLVRSVRSALDRWRLRRENAELLSRLSDSNRRLQESVAERTRDLEGVISLAGSLSRAVAVGEAASAGTAALVAATGSDAGAAYVLDESDTLLELSADVGGAEPFPPRLPLNGSVERGRGGGLDSADRVELQVAGQPVGVIFLIRPRQSNPELVAALSTLAALAVQNAQRFGRERQTVERLSELDRMKDTLLASVSHELRTPLTAIVGFAEVLERQGDAIPTDRRQEILHRMVNQGARLSRLIENVLSSITIKGQAMQVTIGPVPVGDVVERVLGSLPERVNVNVDVDPDLQVLADTGRLEQVVGNLVDNAVKYAGDDLSISAHLDGADRVELAVADRGPGIDPAALDEVFDPFVQGPSGPTVQAGGVGLGLYIARQLVEAMGGTIEVDSRAGEGSTFRVRLRAA
jgi:signal transduction histidine kinase